MHKKIKKLTLHYLFFLLFFINIPIDSMCIESIPRIGATSISIVIAMGAVPFSCLFLQSFFGSTGTYKDGRDKPEQDGEVLFQKVENQSDTKEPGSRSFFSILYNGILIGAGVVIAAGLWNVSQNYSASTTPATSPSPLMVGPVEDVDLTRYVKMPEEIAESFDDLTSLPSALNIIINDIRNGGEPPRGMLFIGEPGAGKSHSSKAFAKECNAILFRIPGYEFTGQGTDFARRLLKLIDKVKQESTSGEKKKPIFLVIDEAEVFGIRSKLGFSSIQLDLGGAVRALMDITEQKESGVTCIFTTNHPELIDSALKRPGRIGEHIEFKLPDKNERHSILKLHAKQKNVSFSADALSVIVSQSEGWTGDYLAQCVEKCRRSSGKAIIKKVKAKQVAIEIGKQWTDNQEKRARVRSPWRTLFTSGFSSVGSLMTGVPVSVFSSGADAVGSLFEE